MAAFAKLGKVAVRIAMSVFVCPSVRMELDSRRMDKP